MPFNLSVPRSAAPPLNILINEGDCLFILGANGTGKSSLVHRLYSANHQNARRIAAHRQTWFSSSGGSMSSSQKAQTEINIQNYDAQTSARWEDAYHDQRVDMAVYDLVDAQNVRARSIADAVDNKKLRLARTLSKKDAPIKTINELMELSNLPIKISAEENGQVSARKRGGAPFSIAELSDGERNALLIAAEVLTVKGGTLLLIDEPERHLHRSIISPLLTHLFAKRPDCAFVISTHDVMLPIDNPTARTLLIRDCTVTNRTVTAFDVDFIPLQANISDDVRRDILGARRRILFVEGIEGSLDKTLYSLVFPNVSVIAKLACRDVEHAVTGIRNSGDLHWLRAVGIVDNDGRTKENIDQLKEKGVYAVSVFSVESVYYHPEVQLRVAKRQAVVTGQDVATRLADAKTAAIAAFRLQIERQSELAALRVIRERIFRKLPTKEKVAEATPIDISIDVAAVVAKEHDRLQAILDGGDLSALVSHYPIRETPALAAIATKLGFQDRDQYESAVRKLMMDDGDALTFVRSLFGTLAADLEAV